MSIQNCDNCKKCSDLFYNFCSINEQGFNKQQEFHQYYVNKAFDIRENTFFVCKDCYIQKTLKDIKPNIDYSDQSTQLENSSFEINKSQLIHSSEQNHENLALKIQQTFQEIEKFQIQNNSNSKSFFKLEFFEEETLGSFQPQNQDNEVVIVRKNTSEQLKNSLQGLQNQEINREYQQAVALLYSRTLKVLQNIEIHVRMFLNYRMSDHDISTKHIFYDISGSKLHQSIAEAESFQILARVQNFVSKLNNLLVIQVNKYPLDLQDFPEPTNPINKRRKRSSRDYFSKVKEKRRLLQLIKMKQQSRGS